MSFHNWALTTSKTPTLWHRPLPARQGGSHRSRYLCLICALGPLGTLAISITGPKPSGRYLHTASFQIRLLCITLGGHMGSREHGTGTTWGLCSQGTCAGQGLAGGHSNFKQCNFSSTWWQKLSLPATSKEQKYWTIPSVCEFHSVANGRIWLLNHKNLNECVYLAHTQIIFYNANDLLPHLCCF